jgi:CRP/FNR family transcriptional regulator, anaerobic regulatory protein
MNRNEFLQSFPVFKGAPPRVVQDLLDASRGASIPAGSQIYREGDACSAIAFVLSGNIRVYKVGQTGREITLYEIGPGETCILNASCILSGRTYPAYAVAIDDVNVVLVPSAVFRRMVSEDESLRSFVFTLLSQRLSGVMELVEEVAFRRMDARLMDYLIEKSENGRLEMTHQRIANDLGTSREVVSRLLKDIERQGQIGLSRNAITLLKQ